MDGYSRLTIPELKDLCKKRGLFVSGSKTDLIERLHLGDRVLRPGGTKRTSSKVESDCSENEAPTPPPAKKIKTIKVQVEIDEGSSKPSPQRSKKEYESKHSPSPVKRVLAENNDKNDVTYCKCNKPVVR
jgi:hypothetical protein